MATLVSTAIGLITCSCAIQFFHMVIKNNNKIQLNFSHQNTRLMVRHFIGQDLYTITKSIHTCKVGSEICNHLITTSINNLILQQQIKPTSSLLILHTSSDDIVYYLRRSTLNTQLKQNNYALYRDDIAHNALALAENVQNLSVQVINIDQYNYKTIVTILFTNSKTVEIECTMPH